MTPLTHALSGFAPAFVSSFAWPMLWQSTLLIGLLVMADFLLSRRLRPAVRYGLWLVLLLKLALPPSLAFPTGLAWWLPRPGPQANPHPRVSTTISYGGSFSPAGSTGTAAALQAPSQTTVSTGTWLLLSNAVLTLGLLGWVLVRWRQVAASAERADPAPAQLDALLQQIRGELHLTRPVQLKLSQGTQSPAVFGLFRPVVLLPPALARGLSRSQMRAVLMHELLHLRRGDVWVNCGQALLQILYWWQPLVWLANARIRRLREQAVDDAVMCALQDQAETYPQTLLEVAKLALRRPLASLALVGILETKNALRQRIERLVELPSPRKPGLTLLSAIGIVAFSAFALPMGQPPLKPAEAAGLKQSPSATWPDPRFAGYAKVSLTARFLIVDSTALAATLPAATGARLPLVFAPNEVAGLEAKLKLSGAQTFPQGEYPEVVLMSGGRFDYWIGTTGDNRVNYLTRTRADGTSVITGAECYYPVPARPDWVPLNLTVVPWTETGSTFCQLQLSVGEDTNAAQEAEATLPAGGAVVWAVSQGIAPGKCEMVFLKETSSELARRPPPEADADKTAKPVKTLVDNLVQEGRLAFELGRLDESEARFREALKEDPQCQAAYYYVNRIAEERAKAAPSTPGATLKQVATKLQQIRLSQIAFDHLPLAEVVAKLNEAIREQDPSLRGRDLIRCQTARTGPEQPGSPADRQDIRRIPITILPALTDVRLRDVLDVVVHVSVPPVSYSIQEEGVILAPAVDSSKLLYTRIIKVGETFFRELSRARGNADLNSLAATQKALRDFFLSKGVDLQPPRTVFFNDRENTVLVHATIGELDKIEKGIAELSDPPPQINIKVSFFKIPRETAADAWRDLGLANAGATNLTALLKAAQAKTVFRKLRSGPGANLVTQLSVRTLSGRPAQAQVTDLREIVEGKATLPIAVGPTVDLMPTLASKGWAIDLQTSATLTELPSDENRSVDLSSSNKARTASKTSPSSRVRVRQLASHSRVPDGYTLLLASPLEPDGTSAEKPQSPEQSLVVLLTPTLIDSTGRRVHTDPEVESATE